MTTSKGLRDPDLDELDQQQSQELKQSGDLLVTALRMFHPEHDVAGIDDVKIRSRR